MRIRNLLSIAMISTVAGLAHGQGTLTLLSDLAGGVVDGRIFNSSGDMSRVVGYATDATGQQASYWDVGTGSLTSLGLGPTGGATQLQGSNEDGTVMVGISSYSSADRRVFRWTQATGMVEMANPGGGFGGRRVQSTEISRDGSTIVHTDLTGPSKAYRYTDSLGYQQLPALSGGWAIVNGVSGDGSVSIGGSNDSRFRAMRWNGLSQQLLSDPVGLTTTYSEAWAITPDAAYTVGHAQTNQGMHAMMWDAAGVGTSLGVLEFNGAKNSVARAVNPDGSVVVGDTNAAGLQFQIAWIHRNGAIVSIAQALAQTGYSFDPTMRFISARGVSDDGLTITGTALLANGDFVPYIVTLPTPSAAMVMGAGLFAVSRRRR
jgi:uncharacterized membrane protein